VTEQPSTFRAADHRARVAPAAASILRRAADLGFLGSMPIEEQIDHALGFVCSVETSLGRAPRSSLDLGSGGGIPGLILASCWPDARLVLLDSNDRRTTFLAAQTAGHAFGARTEVVRGRAEEVGRDERYRGVFEVVTARSFGSPAVTAECGSPFLEVGGVLVVSEPPSAEASRWPEEGLAVVGLSSRTAVRFDDRFGFQILERTEQISDRYPRRVGIPSKRPLF
jgi:16S rRNA (guanine527-N7)-methyltransferase